MKAIMTLTWHQMPHIKMHSKPTRDLRASREIRRTTRIRCIIQASHRLARLLGLYHHQFQINHQNPIANQQICHVHLHRLHRRKSNLLPASTKSTIRTTTLHLGEFSPQVLADQLRILPCPCSRTRMTCIPLLRHDLASNFLCLRLTRNIRRLLRNLHNFRLVEVLFVSHWTSKGRVQIFGDLRMCRGLRVNMVSSLVM